MTLKEKLYVQVRIVENEYYALKGLPTVDIEELKSSPTLSSTVGCITQRQLKERLEKAKENVREAKVARYYATPEGAARKFELESELAEVEDSFKASVQKNSEDMEMLIRPHLDGDWEVECKDAAYVHIYLKDPADGKELFAHGFDLMLGDDIDRIDERVFNVIAAVPAASFDATNDDKTVSLYRKFADIISNKPLMDDILFLMILENTSKETHSERIKEIECKLENPLA